MNDDVRFFAIGDSALTVEFGSVVSPDLNRRAIAFSKSLEEDPFPGFTESVPAYSSVSIFYELATVRKAFPEEDTAFDAVRSIGKKLLQLSAEIAKEHERIVEIPVHFGGSDGPDLEYVAEMTSMTNDEVIEIFLSQIYRVYMLGFLPGFTYMGMVDERIATPRKETPLTKVPKGSVGIAGRQTGVYSLDSPGGWQLIGRTDVEMFTPEDEHPTYLQPGDQVKFVAAR